MVCECNATHCDSVGPVTLPPLGQYSSFLTSRAGSRLEAGRGPVQVNSTGAGERLLSLAGQSAGAGAEHRPHLSVDLSGLRLTIVPYQKYQKIRGFGGAMTDAAAINILSLSAGAQDQLLRQYFSPEGRNLLEILIVCAIIEGLEKSNAPMNYWDKIHVRKTTV